MSSISFIFFDLDDTLLDHRSAERRALGDVRSQYGELFGSIPLLHFQETYHAINSDVWRRYGEGVITKDRAKLERFEGLLDALEANGTASPSELSTYYMNQYSRYWSFLPMARDAFMRISKVFPVGIMTNGFVEIQNAKLDQFAELRTIPSSILISEEIGYMKPDVRLFEHASTAVGHPPDQILYIGDSYRSDIMGGIGAGWQVCWYHPGELPESIGAGRSVMAGDVEIPAYTDWKEILEWLNL
jgi:putative hydrolase of the HAD superfamily